MSPLASGVDAHEFETWTMIRNMDVVVMIGWNDTVLWVQLIFRTVWMQNDGDYLKEDMVYIYIYM